MTEPIFTIANQITLLRLLLIPAFVLLVVYGYFGWALCAFVVAGATDALDGSGAFQLLRPVTGAELVDVISRLEALGKP